MEIIKNNFQSYIQGFGLENLLETISEIFTTSLSDNLIGIYLHGSLAMGCFNDKYSDIDLLVIVENEFSPEIKKTIIDKIIELSDSGKFPPKDLEFSIVKKNYLKPFFYPTPYELHYSLYWKEKLRDKPADFFVSEKRVDKDLGTHFRVLYERGYTLYGTDIKDVLEKPSNDIYLDAIMYDIVDSKEENVSDKEYHILNLCRTYAFLKTNDIMSKREGGVWMYSTSDIENRDVIKKALDYYSGKNYIKIEINEFKNFVQQLMSMIKTQLSVLQ